MPRLAVNAFKRGIDHLTAICEETETLEASQLFTNSPFGPAAVEAASAKKRKSETPPYDSANTDKRKPGTPGKDKKPPIVGALIYKKSGRMPMPTEWPQGEQQLCGANMRNGSTGCRHPKCERSHKPHDQWSQPMKTLMMDHVAQTDDLFWNPEVVTPEKLGLQLNRSAEKVP